MFMTDLGDGFRLAPLEPWHAEAFAVAVDKDRDHLRPYIPFAHRVTDVESAREYLQMFADGHAADERHIAGLWRETDLVGLVMFPDFSPRHRSCEIGVWVSQEYEGRGLITRAARHAIYWAINERGMRRVGWHNDPANARSAAAAARLGFTREGVLRQNFVVVEGGASGDSEVWSILASEWPR